VIHFPSNAFHKLGFDLVLHRAAMYTRTVYGLEELHALVPEINLSQIQFNLTLTQEWMTLIIVEDGFSLETLPDIRDSVNHVQILNSFVNPKELLSIGQTCAQCRKVRQFIERRKENYPLSWSILERMIALKPIEDLILATVNDFGEVKDTASPELRKIRSNLNAKRSQIRASLQKFLRTAQKDGASSDEGITMRNGRMVVPIKAEYKRQFPGFVHDVSSTGQTVYFEPSETLHLNNDIRELESDEKREIERILKAVADQIRPHAISIENNIMLLAQVDLWHAKARLSNFVDGSISQVSKDGKIELHEARNPNLLIKHEGKKDTVIPLSLNLSAEEQLLMITGPNAGGKSVAMKTLGLCVLMNQCGFAVPAREPVILPVFDGVFVDLGDDQSVENDLSTFSSRLVWMRETNVQLSKNSLVLVDEAGAGTDPDEGSSLYQAFFETLMDRKAKTIVTTHHGRLKVFAHEHPNAVNGSMEFDPVALQPTYRFQKGIPGSSYAFEIAGRLDLPYPLISRSRQLLGKKNDAMELLINDLEKEHQTIRSIRDSLRLKEIETEKLRADFEERNKVIREQREKLKTEAIQEARKIIQDANRRVEKLVESIRSNNADKETIKSVRSELESLKKEVTKKVQRSHENASPIAYETPQIGDYITIMSNGSTGTLIEVQGKRATIDINGLRVITKLSDLNKTVKPKEKKKKEPSVVLISSGDDTPNLRASSNRLDIRGKRVEEVDADLIPFLDKAYFSGLQELEIIHGKGTGALRAYIRERLKLDTRIESFADASWETGGPGCTSVKFKKQ